MGKMAIIHTTPITIGVLGPLVEEFFPGWVLMNMLDDSMLPELNESRENMERVSERWIAYADIAARAGADVIVSACSSVGEAAERAAEGMSVPVFRIDEGMAVEAVSSATKIGIAATLDTTLQPTANLLHRAARRLGREIALEMVVADGAYRKLMNGDADGHDAELAAVLKQLAANNERIVLAQASMARVVAAFPEEERSKFYTSPRLGMQYVQKQLGLQRKVKDGFK